MDDIAEEEGTGGALVLSSGEAGDYRPRPSWPRGPGLRFDFAVGWDGRNLVLAPERHLRSRVMTTTAKGGNMRTFSGYSSCFWAYTDVLSQESRDLLDRCALGLVVRCLAAVNLVAPSANLVVLRAFLDRYWDTTTTFHMPGYEAGVTLTDYAVMTGLPCGGVDMEWEFEAPPASDEWVTRLVGSGLRVVKGKKKDSFLVFMSTILSYFQGQGLCKPKESTALQNARLWLWWFLGATYFGEKGERISTTYLRYLEDWDGMGRYDWVTHALGLVIKYCRDAVRPDTVEAASRPSLVGPGLIMEV